MLMKHWIPLLALALTFGLLGTACSKARKVETDNLNRSFAAAPAELKTEIQRALTAIKSKDFDTALAALKTVAESNDLTDDQKRALLDTTTDITVILAEDPPDNVEDLFDLIEDINMALL
jgi:Skp family chaperone for outer membrane proteins